MKRAFLWLAQDLQGPAIEAVKKLGYTPATKDEIETASPGDVFLSWTLWDNCKRRKISDTLQKIGVKTLCFERGWLRGGGHWQIAWRVGDGVGFNGHGQFNAGGPERWASMGFDLAPWRKDGGHILICGNKGALYEGKISKSINHDASWPDSICNRVASLTNRPIHYRPHPQGERAPCLPRVRITRVIDTANETLAQSLAGAWCTVVYASSTASTSICAGVPVIYDGPRIMLHELASAELLDINAPPTPERLPVLERCAWAQWSLDEIASGAAFRHLGL